MVDVLNDPKTDLPAIVREFGAKKKDEDPVIHFYEEFLKAYNAKLRFQRGVFYTPQPVVSYIVRSVHELLQTEFGLEDGLADTTTWGEMVETWNERVAKKTPSPSGAEDQSEGDEQSPQPLTIPDGMSPDDPFVQILDPATGTATFLVEVLDVIHKTMIAKWKRVGMNDAQCRDAWNDYVPQHLLPRVYGYELMMSPYAIAHLKVGLKLKETGYRFHSDKRVRIYLTNSLEGPIDTSGLLDFAVPLLAHEADAVSEVKRSRKFTVVIGNPPYSIQSGNLSRDAVKFIDRFRFFDGKKIKERGMLKFETILQDDYVKFLGFSLDALDQSGIGVSSLITNHAYLSNVTLRGLRQQFSLVASSMYVLDLHGSSTRGGKAPDGQKDENVFDIQQGVAIGTLVLRSKENHIFHGELWGSRSDKYSTLSLNTVDGLSNTVVAPRHPFFLFVPSDTELNDEYQTGFPITELFPLNKVGTITGRDAFAIDFEKAALSSRLRSFCDKAKSDDDMRADFGIKDAGGYKLATRRQLILGQNAAKFIRPVLYRPFDKRFIAFTRGVLTADQRSVMQHMTGGSNYALISIRQQSQIGAEWAGVFVGQDIVESCSISNKTKEVNYVFPLVLFDKLEGGDGQELFSFSRTRIQRS